MSTNVRSSTLNMHVQLPSVDIGLNFDPSLPLCPYFMCSWQGKALQMHSLAQNLHCWYMHEVQKSHEQTQIHVYTMEII